MISVITPSIGDVKKLRNLCHSLQRQKAAPYELLLCTTGAPLNLSAQLPTLPGKIRHLDSPEECISHARNLGLKNAHGDLVLFLDEDCELPYDSYLQDLHQAYLQNPKLCGGGFYLSERNRLNLTSRFYNFFCNFWLQSHLSKENSAQVLLGGCSFYAKKVLNDHNLGFSALYKKAGEEYAFNSAVLQNGYALSLHKRWSVYHNPECNLKGLIKKAWVQGRSIDQRTLKPALHSPRFIYFLIRRPLQSLAALPLLTLYFCVGRIAHWTRVQR